MSVVVTGVNGDSNIVPFVVNELPLVAKGSGVLQGPIITPTVLATFTDTGGPEVNGPQNYTDTIDWGDGTIADTGQILGPDMNGVYSIVGAHAYANTNPFTITITINHEGLSTTVTVPVNLGPVSATGVATIQGVEGQLLNNVTVATFTDAFFNNLPASSYSATITWGDGSTSGGTISGPSGGPFTVTGSHIYAEEGTPDHGGPYQITVTILRQGANPATVTDATNIVDAPLSATGGFNFTGLVLNNVTLATFTDTGGPEPLKDYSASVDWGDGTVNAGTISGPNGSGVFTVTGSHTYASVPRTIMVTLTHETAPPVTVKDTVAGAPVTIFPSGGFTIFGVEGTRTVNATVATFTTNNPNAKASDFTVSIKWGDGPFQGVNDVTGGTISGPDASGVFTVTGSYTYIEESDDVGQAADTPSATPFYVITVTITPTLGSAATALSQARIFDAQLNVTGGFTINGTATTPTGTVVLANFSDPGGQIEIGTNIYIATINWGDGSPNDTQGFTGSGALQVTGNHTYASPGTFTITVVIAHEFATPVTTTDTAVIAPHPAPPGAGGGAQGKSASPALSEGLPPATDLLAGTQVDQQQGTQWVATAGANKSTPVSSGQSNQETDGYWQAMAQENRLMDPHDWASELAMALDGLGRSDWWSAPS
jgi:hypothetical protein